MPQRDEQEHRSNCEDVEAPQSLHSGCDISGCNVSGLGSGCFGAEGFRIRIGVGFSRSWVSVFKVSWLRLKGCGSFSRGGRCTS